jgi:hypothetical protein
MQKDPQQKRSPPLRTCRPGHAVDPQWEKTNCALAQVLTRHHRDLKAAIAIAREIGRGIDELAEQMAILCLRTCRFCPEPCCITNTVWFDFRDLLLCHLLRQHIPVRQAVSDLNAACPFLSHHGCRLLPRSRPWMCLQYLCPAQLNILNRQGLSAATTIRRKIATVEGLRAEMEAEVVWGINHRERSLQGLPACVV